jgi:hypothetical protein
MNRPTTRHGRFRANVAPLALVLAACGPETVELPEVAPLHELLPEVRLGITVTELEALRPRAAVWMDGSHREEFRWHEARYHFSPRGENLPPPPMARLLAVEARENLGDSLRLWPAWLDGARQIEERLGREPRCLVLGGAQATISRAEFVSETVAGPVVVSVSAEILRALDGQHHRAYLVTRAGLGTLELRGEQRLRVLRAACDALGPGGR